MYYIKTYNQIEGFHYWPRAPEEVEFLSRNHRHIFTVRCKKILKNGDREIELILAQRKIEAYLKTSFGSPCDFKNLSCELIAQMVCEEFNFDEVEVLEDGISGGGYRR